jgi:predicted site-specific integrase-resolvase
MSNKELPRRLRAKQIAKLYGVSVPTLWRYARLGKITPIKITKGVTVFDSQEIEKFFNGEKVA